MCLCLKKDFISKSCYSKYSMNILYGTLIWNKINICVIDYFQTTLELIISNFDSCIPKQWRVVDISQP